MVSEGYCTEADLHNKKNNEELANVSCISPRLILSRWFSRKKFRGAEKTVDIGERKGKERGQFHVKRKSEAVNCSTKCLSSSSSSRIESEHAKQTNSNLGIGFALVYLLAASRNELNEIMELHKQMKVLIQNLQTEFQNQEKPLLRPSESRISLSFSRTGVSDVPCTKDNISHQFSSSNAIENSEITVAYSRCPSKTIYRRERSLRMDQLEAELETEFCRLQLHMDTQYMLENAKQQCTEVNIENSVPEDNLSTTSREIIELPESREFYGVHAGELACRLHEVLEERQEERIKELESAIEYIMHKLHEKERELSWWKEAATILSPFQSLACRSRQKISSQLLEN